MKIHRPSNLILWVALVAQLVSGTPQATEAIPITFQTSGPVVSASPALAGTFSPGSGLSLSFTFATPPRAGSTALAPGPPEIRTGEAPAGINNGYTLVSRASDGSTGPGGANPLTEFRMLLDNSPGTVFTYALNLPTDNLALNSFDARDFLIFFSDPQEGINVLGDLEEFRLIPAPGALLLLGSGLAGLVALCWRHQRRQ